MLRTTVASPVDHDGPAMVNPVDREKFASQGKGKFLENSDPRTRGSIQGLIYGPWHLTNSPSISTTIGAYLLTFVSSLFRGWVVAMALVGAFASGADTMTQALIVAFVSAASFIVTMIWMWEPLLPTYITWAQSFASIGTFDASLLSWGLHSIFMLGGYACGGWIVRSIVGVTIGVQPQLATSERCWEYWIAGSFITFSFIFLRKFVRRYDETIEMDIKDRRREKVYKNSVYIAALALFIVVMTFYQRQVFYFDATLYLTMLIVGGGSTEWYIFIFVSLANAATALLLYYLFQIISWASDKQEGPANQIQQQARYERNPNNERVKVF